MTAPFSSRWPEARVLEARAIVADVAHHSDHLVRLACKVLSRHGETECEREDARILLVVLDARARPGRGLFDREHSQ